MKAETGITRSLWRRVDLLEPDSTISHYRIVSRIGAGGMGEVYRGVDVRLDRTVAIKVLNPSSDLTSRQRLIREAQTASLLDHPNICTIFEVDETDAGEVFIVMAYYDGETLAHALEAGPLDVSRALAIAIQTGRGLAAAHQELIVHRDIKPANLILTRGDTVKILDFGIAALPGDANFGDGTPLVGTPAYMSPEQLRGGPVDHRTDIWSLGAVLYEMVTGTPAFPGEDINAQIRSVLHAMPAPASELCPDIPRRLDSVIAKALTKDLHHRYEQIETMIHDLLSIRTAIDSDDITLRLSAVSAKKSVAVLPFQDMSSAKDQEFLCDGIAEEILRALSRIPELHVVSRTSAFQFKNRAADIREIGMRLNVDNIIEGSVRRAGDRVRISAQLVNVENGYRLWYERYDRYMKDILALEDEIADQIAQALKVTLVGANEKPPAFKTSSPEAYELYLQGRRFFHQHRRKAIEIAIQVFSQAIEIDPENAMAFAGIADCYSFLNLYFGRGDEAIEAAEQASCRALELAPGLADAHSSRGLALFLKKDLAAAEHHLKRAIEIDPHLFYPRYIYGRVCFSQGRHADAALHFREACAYCPEAYDSWYLLGMCYRKLGNEAKARRADLECIEAVKQRVHSNPDDTRAWTMGASVLVELGEPERAVEWLKRALDIDADEPFIMYNAACVYVALGRPDDAIACLRSAASKPVFLKDWAINDPDLDPLRSDPRFQAIIDRL